MYICADCGRIMEGCSSWTEPHGEDLHGCYYCGGAVEEARRCAICGEYHLEEDLTNRICNDCTKSEITYDYALKYFKEKKMLRDFFIVYYWGISPVAPDSDNDEFDAILERVFIRKSNCDKETGKTTFLKQLQDYILEDIYDWTEFLAKEVNG